MSLSGKSQAQMLEEAAATANDDESLDLEGMDDAAFNKLLAEAEGGLEPAAAEEPDQPEGEPTVPNEEPQKAGPAKAPADKASTQPADDDFRLDSLDNAEDVDISALLGVLDGGKKAQPEDQQPEPQKQANIPAGRFNEVNEEKKALQEERDRLMQEMREMREQMQYMKGRVDTLATMPQQPASQQQQPQVDPIEQLNTQLQQATQAYNSSIDAIADQFDKGKIGMAEYKQKERELNEKFGKIQNNILSKRRQVVNQQDRNPQAEEDRLLKNPWLVSQTEKLVQANPWLDGMPDPVFDGLEQTARRMCQEQGATLTGPRGAMNIRKAMAAIGRHYGYDRVYGTSANGQGQPGQPQGGQPMRTFPTARQRADKIDLSNNHPPHVSDGGTGIPGDGTSYTNEQMESMTDDQMLAMLPEAKLAQMRGGM